MIANEESPMQEKSGRVRSGKARMEKLSPGQRSELARVAALKRWTTEAPIKSDHVGSFKLGETEIPCAVIMEGGKEVRLVSERALVKSFGGKRGGSHWRRLKQRDASSANLPVILSATNLRPFISDDLIAALNDRRLFTGKGMRSPAYGVRAELYPKICEVYLKARDAGALKGKQKQIAIAADILTRSLAQTAIAALVDEATGYQRARRDRALEEILNHYIGLELAKWAKRFPDDFYKQMCRLRRLDYDPDTSRRPLILARITIDVVYDRIGPGLTEELKRRKAAEISRGGKQHKLHQWLTDEIGHPALAHHLSGVTFLAKNFRDGDWDAFVRALDRITPAYNRTMLLDFPDEDGSLPSGDSTSALALSQRSSSATQA